jgi:Zn-dependent M28 family amino/carboxypeptidase
MIKKRLVATVMVLFVVCLLASSAVAAPYEPGKAAFAQLKELSEDSRVAGTQGESEAREYIMSEFKDMGYSPALQRFTFKTKSKAFSSANVIAEKPGKSSKVVIVGAHYDSLDIGNGADDNASGVAVMLETAERLMNITTPYTIRFVAFGAEEVGFEGSKYYVSQMSYSDIQNTVAMINLDSLAVGDKMYVYGGEAGWVRDQALTAADKKKVKLETNPGLNPEYPAGTTGLWSDHAAFAEKGIPFAYFEATNWELGDQDGYTQTVQDGEVWHTEKDTLQYIEANYPGRIQEHLSGFTAVLVELMDSIKEVGRVK